MVFNCELALLGCDAPKEVSLAVICNLYIFRNKRTDQNPRNMPWVKAIQEILQPADLLYLYHLFVSEIWPFKDHQRDHINFQWKSQRVYKFYSSALVFAGTVKNFPTFPRGTLLPWQHQIHWGLSKLLENCSCNFEILLQQRCAL